MKTRCYEAWASLRAPKEGSLPSIVRLDYYESERGKKLASKPLPRPIPLSAEERKTRPVADSTGRFGMGRSV